MESSERCASECQGSSDDDSVQVQRTPEKLTSIIHFSEAITTFSEMCIAESPVSRQLESQQAKRPSNSRLNEASKQRTLFPAKSQENILWTDDEIYSLIVFLMLFSNGKTWVARKDKKFWEDAATFIKLHSCTSHCRTGASCRSRATAVLAKQFSSPAVAEQHYLAKRSILQSSSIAVTSVSSCPCSQASLELQSLPAQSDSSLLKTTPNSLSWTIPSSTSLSQTAPSSTPLSWTIPSLTSLSQTVPSSTSLSWTVPSSTPLSWTIPSLTSLSWTVPSSTPLSWTIPSLTSLSWTVPSTLMSSMPQLHSLTGTSSILAQLPSTSLVASPAPVSLTTRSSIPSIVPMCATTTTTLTRSSIPSIVPKSATTTTTSSKMTNPNCCQQEQQTDVEQIQTACWELIEILPPDQQCKVISSLFDMFLQKSTTLRSVSNFIQFAVNGMNHLKRCNRSNVIYLLAKTLGTLRPDESDSLLPAKRMPMGLIEYCVNFFNAKTAQQVSCPSDYRSWLETMYVLFGTKWCKLFTGPAWSHVPVGQVLSAYQRKAKLDPIDALINIPALSERTIRRDIAANDFTTGPEVQTAVLRKLASVSPNSRWWIKGDGTNVTKGLWESVSGKWDGDVDLNDGKLGQLYMQYENRIKQIKSLGMQDQSTDQIRQQLVQIRDDIATDMEFLSNELQKANSAYEEKLLQGHLPDKTMFSLSWDVEELKSINAECRTLFHDIEWCIDACSLELFHRQNVPRKLTTIKLKLSDVVRRTMHFQRSPATHVFVFMISSDSRSKKPYSLPVQCIPYSGLKEVELRRLINDLCKEMISLGMNVSGFVSDGEFNFLRAKGYTRPLSVLHIRSTIRNMYSRMSVHKMLTLITPKGKLPDGTIQVQGDICIVPQCVLQDILVWMKQGISWKDIIQRLPPKTVPPGYVYHTWSPGKTESFEDQLRSVLAQYHFAYEIKQFEAKGVPFRSHLYVPEKHPATNDRFFEREDEAHLIKHIASHTRSGGPSKLNLEHYTEALSDPTSGLTYPAFVGSRKQSVVDAERLFSPKLAAFMDKKGYSFEAHYIKTVWNWRRASDERGLCSLERSRFNYQFLNMILKDLMPWYKEFYDFSLLEVNRSVNDVLGFSRETLIAVITNIEGREFHRREQVNNKQTLEHPRASSTDDVECFFSMMRDVIGQNFTTKEVKFGMRKIISQFVKRVDPDLPFYYHSSSHTRFYEGCHSEFDKKPDKKPKEKRLPRREQPAAFVPRRATMPVRGGLAVRPKFHNLPLELPPPPNGPIFLHEHSYAQSSK